MQASKLSFFVALIMSFPSMAAELSIAGRGELYLSQSPDTERYQRAWWQDGTSQLAQTESFAAGPQYLLMHLEGDSDWSAQLNAQWHHAPQAGGGVTEAWVQYNPLPWSGYRVKARLGYFYPALSLENTDLAWTSPYSSYFSAVNSWIVEEIKPRGLEFSVSRPSRFFNSQHSQQWILGLFQGNDPAGTVLTWRGFAIHPYQTSLFERLSFANYPSIGADGPVAKQPNWVEPNRELDNKTGYYLGWHWLYQDTEVRLYHYDNKADPQVFTNQYGWHSRFTNLSAQHQLNEQVRLIGQYLSGDTLMGDQVVKADYRAWFLMVNYQQDQWQATLRYDHFKVVDRDQTAGDDNNGNGHGWTYRLVYQLSEQTNAAVEYNQINSVQASRGQWQNWPVDNSQSSLRLVLTYQFGL